MRFHRKFIGQLAIPRHSDCHCTFTRGQPAIVMAAPLAKALAVFGKAKKWHEEEVGLQDRRIGKRLEKAEGADFEIFFIEWIGMPGKLHRRILLMEARQSDLMTAFEKKFRVGRRRSFEGIGAIEPNHRVLAYDIEQRTRRPVKYERTHRIR